VVQAKNISKNVEKMVVNICNRVGSSTYASTSIFGQSHSLGPCQFTLSEQILVFCNMHSFRYVCYVVCIASERSFYRHSRNAKCLAVCTRAHTQTHFDLCQLCKSDYVLLTLLVFCFLALRGTPLSQHPAKCCKSTLLHYTLMSDCFTFLFHVVVFCVL